MSTNSYQYGSALYPNHAAAVTAMCEDYLTAQGSNEWDSETVVEALANPARTAAEMSADGWNSLYIVGRYDDDGEQASEDVSMDDLEAALTGIAEWRAGIYRVTVGSTEVGETMDPAEVPALVAEAREMTTWVSHMHEGVQLTYGGKAIDLDNPRNRSLVQGEESYA